MPDLPTIWKYVLAIWNHVSDTAIIIGASLDKYGLEPTGNALERGRAMMAHHPNVVAAAIYLFIVLITTWGGIWLLRKNHIHRVMVRNWDMRAGKHVLYFMLTVALANGILHAIHQVKLPFLNATAPLEAFAGVPFVQNMSLNALLLVSLNLLLLVLLCGFFVVDAIRNETFYLPGFKIRRAASYYFGHVIGIGASEVVVTAVWEHLEAKTVVGEALKLIPSRGKNILIAIIVVGIASWLVKRYLNWLSEMTPPPKTAEGS
jgi:hypothetical protein